MYICKVDTPINSKRSKTTFPIKEIRASHQKSSLSIG